LDDNAEKKLKQKAAYRPLTRGKIFVRPSEPHIYISGSDGRTRIRQQKHFFWVGTRKRGKGSLLHWVWKPAS
jgi:hypothetical protein